jgi:hypothetical protein
MARLLHPGLFPAISRRPCHDNYGSRDSRRIRNKLYGL